MEPRATRRRSSSAEILLQPLHKNSPYLRAHVRWYNSDGPEACHSRSTAARALLARLTNTFPTQNCRERYGEQTCNKRRTLSELQSEFPDVVFEDGFEEEDVLWTSECENDENLERRAKLVLDRIFQNDCDDTCRLCGRSLPLRVPSN